MKKINLFIARTPLQLFNCIEAKNRFHVNEKNVLFYQYQRSIDKNQIESIIYDHEWTEVIAYPLSPFRRLFPQYFLKKCISKYQNKVACCYFGAYNSIISYFINKVKPKDFFIVDDGVKTIEISELIKKKKLDKKGFFRFLINKIMNSSRNYIYISKFFTIYDEVEVSLPNRVVKNDYRAFKKNITTLEEEKIVYFIGTNLLEKILKTKNIFEEELKKVILYYREKNQEVVYILHRYENTEYMKSLSIEYKFEFVKFDNIIEVELLKRGLLPTEIASFASTAIGTINIIYGVDATIFELENSGIFDKYQDTFAKLYDNFRKKGVEVIGL